jgi:hypothetical protein
MDVVAIPSQVVEHLRLGNKRLLAPITLIDIPKRFPRAYAGCAVVALLRHRSRPVVQEGASSMRFVAGAGRQCGYSRSAEQMRTDSDANGHFGCFSGRQAHE